MYIAVDFDGTIVEHKYPIVGEPVNEAVYWMDLWVKAGAQIILWTMRSGKELQDAVEYLSANNIPLFGVNENPTQFEWTYSPKAYAAIYVDDAAYGCPLVRPKEGRPYVNWVDVGPTVLDKLMEK